MRWSAAETLSWVIDRKPIKLPSWPSYRGRQIELAQRELATAIANGGVRAWGRNIKKPALLEQIPADPFKLKKIDRTNVAVVVGVHGDIAVLPPHKRYPGDDDARWRDIEFDQVEIKREWPMLPSKKAQDWMLKEARRLHAKGQIGKRDDMVRRCMKDTGCTKRLAEAAHQTLPKALRRARGKPPKNSG